MNISILFVYQSEGREGITDVWLRRSLLLVSISQLCSSLHSATAGKPSILQANRRNPHQFKPPNIYYTSHRWQRVGNTVDFTPLRSQNREVSPPVINETLSHRLTVTSKKQSNDLFTGPSRLLFQASETDLKVWSPVNQTTSGFFQNKINPTPQRKRLSANQNSSHNLFSSSMSWTSSWTVFGFWSGSMWVWRCFQTTFLQTWTVACF